MLFFPLKIHMHFSLCTVRIKLSLSPSPDLRLCTGFGWDRVESLHSSLYRAVLWTCAGNSADSTGVAKQCLHSVKTFSTSHTTLPESRLWYTGKWCPNDQRDIPDQMTLCSAVKVGGIGKGGTLQLIAFVFPSNRHA